MKQIAILALFAAVMSAALPSGPTYAFEATPLAKPEVTPIAAHVERILGAEDVQRYREIFTLQANGNWRAADKRIKRLSNTILMGHVTHQRLMHPTKYRARYSELKTWLSKYRDHPEAKRVYRLAVKRRGKASWPKKPARVRRKGSYEETAEVFKDRRSHRNTRRSIARDIRNNRLTIAGERLFAAFDQKKLNHQDLGRLAESLNRAWVAWGTPEKGLEILTRAAPIARPARVTTDWQAGLAAWALEDYTAAQLHFTAVATYKDYDDLAAAGGVWAARAALRGKAVTDVSALLRGAYDRAPDSFYGLIAARQLGIEVVRNWAPPRYKASTWAKIKSHAGARRAIALSQVGQSERADAELLHAWYKAKASDYEPLLALAYALDLPQAQVRIAESAPKGKTAPLLSLYPIPSWQPTDGFRTDPAMLFALIRQESRFSNRARSRSGARGLMQVMPRTAGYIGRDRRLIRDRQNLLYDPEFNMSLGQRYVNYLKDHKATNGDMIFLLAAYNGGPGNVNKWRRNIKTSDPLWFIEHIPLRETRAYVEQVAANYWIYRMAMGLETQTLDRIAAGFWPEFEADSLKGAPLPAETILSDARRYAN
jgi:soluble lytic murein transglycosylase-like protein